MKRAISTLVAGFVVFALFGELAPLAAQEAKAKKIVSIEGITEYELPNGCRFLLFPDPSASTVTMNMTVLVGSRHEGYGETGMAHLLEHMLFKGSKNYPNPDKDLESRGADYNGTTWTDRTNYYETMPATDANLEFGIKFEADRLVNCFVKREDLIKEMTVVRNEFEQGENDPESILNQRMMAVAFEWHNYGKSTIGNRTDIERVPIERLQAFYRKYYQPDNVFVVIAGKFDEAKAVALMTKHFGAIPQPARSLDATYTEEPAQDGERTVTLRRVGKVSVVGLMYHIPAASHEDHASCALLEHILGNAPSGRLYKALVETKKASSVSVDATKWHDPGVLEVTARVAEKASAEEVRDIAVNVVENFLKQGATQEEVDRAKQKYKSDRERALTKSKSIALELSNWAGAGDWRLMFIHRDRIAKVTPESVNKVASKYLQQSNRTVGIFVPTTQVARTFIPETPDVAKLVKDYKGGEAIALGETFDPTPKNIEARVQRLTLSNGVKVAFLPKKTRGEAVVGNIVLHFGNEKSLQEHTVTSSFVGSLLTKGTKNKTRQQIQDALDKLGSTFSTGSGAGQLTASFQTKRSQLPELLELVREVLREPSFPENEFDIVKRNQRQAVEKAMVSEQALAFRTLMRTIKPHPKNDVRYIPTFEEGLARLEKVTRNDVVRLYEEQIGGTHGEIVLVGDFDPKTVTPLLEKIVAGWKSDVAYERIRDSADMAVKSKRETIQVPDKEGAVFVSAHVLELRDDAPDYPAAELGSYILGNGFTSRLMERLRQKEGWCYGAGAQLQADAQDNVGMLMSYAICNPQNIDKVDKGTLEEMRKLIKEGTTSEELAKAQKGYLQEMQVQRGNDSMLAGMLRQSLYLGRTFQYFADLEKKIEGLSVEDVNRAVGKYISPDRLVIIRAGDFSKKASAPPQK